jgi:hypothetical protein
VVKSKHRQTKRSPRRLGVNPQDWGSLRSPQLIWAPGAKCELNHSDKGDAK